MMFQSNGMVRSWRVAFWLALAPLAAAAPPRAAVITAAASGAVGDGITDDGPALRKALQAALAAGPGARLVLEKRTYRLGPRSDHDFQWVVTQARGLTIDGNGATLRLSPRNGVLQLSGCREVTVRGLTIEHDPLPFTQGVIAQVDPAAATFDLDVDAGYRLPPADAEVKKLLGAGGWEWGSVIDPAERHLRWDVSPHFFIAGVEPSAGVPRRVRVQVTAEFGPRLAPVRPGDRFFLPLPLAEDGARALGSNFQVSESADCTLEQITIHSARSGMNFAIVRNEGRITLRAIRIAFAPGTSQIVTTWRDGMHCKNNRVGPLIEDCFFEGLLDDSINLSADTAMASRVIAENEFQLTGAPFAPGDRVMVFDPLASRIVCETKVLKINGQGNQASVVLAAAVPAVVTGTKRPQTDLRATHFYNLDRTNHGFVVRNCTFLAQRRHAILVRADGGLIENNRIEGVGGSAVSMGNELGSFYEGPFPHDNLIRHNTISDTQGTAIALYSRALSPNGRHTRDIQIVANQIRSLPGKTAISLDGVTRVTLAANTLTTQDGSPAPPQAVTILHSTEVSTTTPAGQP